MRTTMNSSLHVVLTMNTACDCTYATYVGIVNSLNIGSI